MLPQVAGRAGAPYFNKTRGTSRAPGYRPVMAARFDTDTDVVPQGDGRFLARIDPGWFIDRGPNGGYIAAMLVRAAVATVGDPERHLRSLTVHYLAPAVEGAAEVTVVTERAGRTVHFVAARLTQGDRLIAVARAALARTGAEAPSFAERTFPGYAAPDTIDDPPAFLNAVTMRERYEYKHVLGAPWDGPGATALTGGWMRLSEQRPYDAALLAAMSDAWFPAIFTRLPPPFGVPTIDLTVHIRSVAALLALRRDDWVAVRFRTTTAVEGFLEEEGELWAPDGTLLAQSRQLGLILAP